MVGGEGGWEVRPDSSASSPKLKMRSVPTRLSKPNPLSSAGISSDEEEEEEAMRGNAMQMGRECLVSSGVDVESRGRF